METSFDHLRVFLSLFLVNLPTFVVCALACVVIVGRWGTGSRYAFWAILGFGLALLLCLVLPAVQTALQQWAVQGGGQIRRAWVFSVFAVIASILHAAIYGCLLAAILAGRTEQNQ